MFRFGMLGIRRKQHKILWPVIALIMIDMMNTLIGFQESSKHLLHHQAMLKYITIRWGMRMI